jgi:uncharacterized protein YqfA (UPF0365 family)
LDREKVVMPPAIYFALGFATAVATLVPLAIMWWIAGPWMRVLLTGGRASIFSIIGMRLRGSPVPLILDAYLALVQKGKSVTLAQVESAYIANRGRIFTAADLLGLMPAEMVQK